MSGIPANESSSGEFRSMRVSVKVRLALVIAT